MINKQIFIKPSEVACRLGVSRSTIYRWYWEGKLKGVKLSDKNIRILADSVDQLIEKSW